MNIIYITHCCAKKNDIYKNTGESVFPEVLYISNKIQGFITKCKNENVEWAILSDKYGVVFPDDKILWYEKHPNSVTKSEYIKLLNGFVTKLSNYDEIRFYHNPGRFHKLYKKIIRDASNEKLNILMFSKKQEIIRFSNNNKKELLNKNVTSNRQKLNCLFPGLNQRTRNIVVFSNDCRSAYVRDFGLSLSIFTEYFQILFLDFEKNIIQKIDFKPIEKINSINYVYSFDISYDKKFILSGGFYEDLHLWDIVNEKEVRTEFNNLNLGPIYQIKFFDNDYFAVVGCAGGIALLDINARKTIRHFNVELNHVNNLTISHNGKYMCTSTNANEIILLDLTSGISKFKKVLPSLTESMAISEKNNIVLSCCVDGSIYIWDLTTGASVGQLHHGSKNFIKKDVFIVFGNRTDKKEIDINKGISISLSPDQIMASTSSSQEKTIILWDIKERSILHQLSLDKAITNIKFTTNNNALLIGCLDGSVYSWNY